MNNNLIFLFLILISCSSSPTKIPKDWKKIDTQYCSLYVPKVQKDSTITIPEGTNKGTQRAIVCGDSAKTIIVGISSFKTLFIEIDKPTVLDAAYVGFLRGIKKQFRNIEDIKGEDIESNGFQVRDYEFTSTALNGHTFYHKIRIIVKPFGFVLA